MSAEQAAQRITLRRSTGRLSGVLAFIGRAWKKRWEKGVTILASLPFIFYFILWLLFARGLPDAEPLLNSQPVPPTSGRDITGGPVQTFARERRVQLAYREFPVPLINA